MKLEEIGKVDLGKYPTELEELKNLNEKYKENLSGGKIFIKRDDMAGPALGGNKTRKLEYLLKDAIDKGCTAVVTEGGLQTNHGRTTVAACIKLGLKPILVLYGKKPEYLSGNLVLDALMGADIFYIDNMAKREETLQKIAEKYAATGDRVYEIPMGGSNEIGALGYMDAVREIIAQSAKDGIKVNNIVSASGSMGTYVGLLIGAKYYKTDYKIIGVPVIPEYTTAKAVLEYANRVIEFYGLNIEVEEKDIHIINGPADFPFAGFEYNKPDEITRKAILEMATTEAIILDPTYTGKGFRGLLHMISEGVEIKPGDNTVFIHTGGIAGLLSKEHTDEMQNQIRENCSEAEISKGKI